MDFRPLFLPGILLTAWLLQSDARDDLFSDANPDAHIDTQPDANVRTRADALETHADADIPETPAHTHADTHADTHSEDTRGEEDHGDADWHPSSFHPDVGPAQGGGGGSSRGEGCGGVTRGHAGAGSCGVEVTLVPGGSGESRCPDPFRCSEQASHWLLQNQDRKQEVEDLKETASQLQEELRDHRRRVKNLEQREDRVHPGGGLLQFHQGEVDTLLHVHGVLLYQLQDQLHNLSSTVERIKHTPGCLINIIQSGSPLSLREALHPEVQQESSCPVDCASLYFNGVRHSGVYTVIPSLRETPLDVYCDMETDGGGWTVVQRRADGSVTFNRGWREYRAGFGQPGAEHWLGNEVIHLLTNQGHYSLRIHLEDWTHTHTHVLYSNFSLEDEHSHYRLHVSGFSGSVSDSFGWYHDNQVFSTPDTGNICSEISHSGWWFHQCYYANLNGVYYQGGHYSSKGRNVLGPDGIVWFSLKDSDYYSLKSTSMMIRPSSFRTLMSP